MKTQEMKDLSNAIGSLHLLAGELNLWPEEAGDFAANDYTLAHLRAKASSITAMLESMSTPVDIAPPALPLPPAEIYLPMPSYEFIALVRAGKVRAETPDGDTSRVQIDRSGYGWACIGWDYELYDDVAVDYESFHESMTVDSDTHLQWHDGQVIVGDQTFTLTQEP